MVSFGAVSEFYALSGIIAHETCGGDALAFGGFAFSSTLHELLLAGALTSPTFCPLLIFFALFFFFQP